MFDSDRVESIYRSWCSKLEFHLECDLPRSVYVVDPEHLWSGYHQQGVVVLEPEVHTS